MPFSFSISSLTATGENRHSVRSWNSQPLMIFPLSRTWCSSPQDLGFCLSPLSQVMSRYLACTLLSPSISVLMTSMLLGCHVQSLLQEIVLSYASGWCLSSCFLWKCSPGDSHWSALLLCIQHVPEFLCLVLQYVLHSQTGYQVWKVSEFGAEVMALHHLRHCTFSLCRARPWIKVYLPSPSFLAVDSSLIQKVCFLRNYTIAMILVYNNVTCWIPCHPYFHIITISNISQCLLRQRSLLLLLLAAIGILSLYSLLPSLICLNPVNSKHSSE